MMTFEEFIRDYEPVPGAEDALYLMCSSFYGKKRFAQFAAQFPDLTVADLQQCIDEDIMKCVKSLTNAEGFKTYDYYFDLLCKHFGIDDNISKRAVLAWAELTGVYQYKRNDTEQEEEIACKFFREYIEELKNPSKGYYDFCDCLGLDPKDTVNLHRKMYLLADDVVFNACYRYSKNFTAKDVQDVYAELLDYFAAHAPNRNPTNVKYSRMYSFASAVGASVEALALVLNKSEEFIIQVLQFTELCLEKYEQKLEMAAISEATKEFDPLQYAKMRLKDLSKVDTDAIAKCKNAKECEALVSAYF